jgi:hypothetical protein
VAAIMALLPVSVKFTSDSIGDTLSADAANSIIAHIDRVAWEDFDTIQKMKTARPSTYFSDSKRIELANEKLGGSDSYKFVPDIKTGITDGHFAFLFGTPDEKNDFAAEVFCWKAPFDSNFKLTTIDSTGAPKSQVISNIKNENVESGTAQPALVRVFIEISWPIAKPYKKGSVYPRESRTFVREYLDPAYSKVKKN